jgi:hypothetical protein
MIPQPKITKPRLDAFLLMTQFWRRALREDPAKAWRIRVFIVRVADALMIGPRDSA